MISSDADWRTVLGIARAEWRCGRADSAKMYAYHAGKMAGFDIHPAWDCAVVAGGLDELFKLGQRESAVSADGGA